MTRLRPRQRAIKRYELPGVSEGAVPVLDGEVTTS